MVVMMNVDAEVAQLSDEELDFMLLGVRSHVSQLFVLFAANYFVNCASDPISDRNLGFIGRAKTKFPAIVFSPIKRSAL
jgi:hypothetical protein